MRVVALARIHRPLPDRAPVIRFDSVSKDYPGGHAALSDVSFALAAGEMAFVTGHSGAGKSTLLKLIAMLERPSSGHVEVQGRPLERLHRRDVPPLRRSIGMVFQDHRLLPERSVADNVGLPLAIAGVARRARGERVAAALARVGLADRGDAAPTALSAGEQQRVGIARAIVAQPSVLIADEPTGNLDPELSETIMRLFVSLRDTGCTLLIASHDLPLLKRMKQRVVVLDHGHLIDDVPASEVA